jgi:hypothetical protein
MNSLPRGAGWLLAVVGLVLAVPVLAEDPIPVATNLWSIQLSRFDCHSSPTLALDG